MLCHDMLYFVHVLQFSAHDHSCIVQDSDALFLEEVRHNDDIRNAGLIFKTEKQNPLRCAGPLAYDDIPGYTHRTAIAKEWKFCGRSHPKPFHLCAMVCHGMLSDSHASDRMIGKQPFFQSHLPQRCLGLRFSDALQ